MKKGSVLPFVITVCCLLCPSFVQQAYANSFGESLISVKAGDSVIKFNTNSIDLGMKPVLKNGSLFVPLRETLNALGFERDKIAYNTETKAVTIKKGVYFETELITVTDRRTAQDDNGVKKEKTFSVSDKVEINKIVTALNQEPFYETDVVYRLIHENEDYSLNFNNGVTVCFTSASLRDCHIHNKYGITRDRPNYQVLFSTAKVIEDFIRENGDYGKVLDPWEEGFIDWNYDDRENKPLYGQEYIVCDFLNDDYSPVIEYLQTKIKNFDAEYKYSVEEYEYGTHINFESDKNRFTINVYSGGVNRSDIDKAIKDIAM